MVNVLPKNKQLHLRLAYYVRLVVVLCIGLSVALVIGALLLVPSYFASRNQADDFERFRDALEGSVGLQDREGLNATMATLSERVRLSDGYTSNSFTVDFFESLLSNTVSGVSIRSISFSRQGESAAVTVAGIADSREDLLDLVNIIRANPQFRDVNFPVSQLVAETNVGFSIQAVYEQP